MDYVVIAYLWLSILLYLVLGGADFGAGIVELFTSPKNRKRTRKTLYHTIGPVWEANHMWLVIAVVILFVGFPSIYSVMSVYLHIPVLLMLMGIIARGTAFVFRHYDAVRDNMQRVYNRIFISSSFLTPFFLGIIAGSSVSGDINPLADDFLSAYIFSWLSLFSISVGVFTVTICGFLAATYLVGEADDEHDRNRFIRKAKHLNIAAVASGALVFAAAEIDNIPLAKWIFAGTPGQVAVVLATVSLVAFWYFVRKGEGNVLRVLAGMQITMILVAISYVHFPDFLVLKGGDNLSLLDHQAPDSTMNALAWALLIGSVFILPALFYLFYSFQATPQEEG